MDAFFLNSKDTALLVMDVQEKLFPTVENNCEILEKLSLMIQGAKLLKLPILVTEQYPKGLGKTIAPLLDLLPENQTYLEKTSFSALFDPGVQKAVTAAAVKQWIVVGLEAHVCVLQTAKSLHLQGKQVVVLNDAISSQSIYDYSTAISEIKDWARISSSSAVLFELLGDANHPCFKQCLELLKGENKSSCCHGCCG